MKKQQSLCLVRSTLKSDIKKNYTALLHYAFSSDAIYVDGAKDKVGPTIAEGDDGEMIQYIKS